MPFQRVVGSAERADPQLGLNVNNLIICFFLSVLRHVLFRAFPSCFDSHIHSININFLCYSNNKRVKQKEENLIFPYE